MTLLSHDSFHQRLAGVARAASDDKVKTVNGFSCLQFAYGRISTGVSKALPPRFQAPPPPRGCFRKLFHHIAVSPALQYKTVWGSTVSGTRTLLVLISLGGSGEPDRWRQVMLVQAVQECLIPAPSLPHPCLIPDPSLPHPCPIPAPTTTPQAQAALSVCQTMPG